MIAPPATACETVKTIIPGRDESQLAAAVAAFRRASSAAALTGAGISVASGIDDFRSPGGLWTVFAPEEYATLDVFRRNPAKAWLLYRAIGQSLLGKKPNPAHETLAELERRGLLRGLVTQNVDRLHQAAGSRRVLEIHGDHLHLQCLRCGQTTPVTDDHYLLPEVPSCERCSYPYKPNVVLFGEAVRDFDRIEELLTGCDLLLVIGTSAAVYPAAGLPALVKDRGGLVYEFNRQPALAAEGGRGRRPLVDFFFQGELSRTLPLFGQAVLGQ